MPKKIRIKNVLSLAPSLAQGGLKERAKTSFNNRLALRRLTAARVPQNTSRHFVPLWYFASPHFASPGLASQVLIRAGKTSPTFNVKRNTKCSILKMF
jgi:hypothetical protein